MARFESGQASENDDCIADADEVFDSRGVPVRETNATVTGGAADRLRIICAVNADAGFVQAHPNYTDEIVRARRQIVIIFRANSVVEHSFVVAEPRPGRRALNLPGADWRRQCG